MNFKERDRRRRVLDVARQVLVERSTMTIRGDAQADMAIAAMYGEAYVAYEDKFMAGADDPAWAEPCEAQFKWLAGHDPQALVAMILGGDLRPSMLTFALEALRPVPDRVALPALLMGLAHPDSIVREGAIYGCAGRDNTQLICLISFMALTDPSEAVKSVAKESLESLVPPTEVETSQPTEWVVKT